MSHFDEKSGIVPVNTEWGKWWQTIDEIYIEINIDDGSTTSKDIQCLFSPQRLKITVKNRTVIDGELTKKIIKDEAIWTLEDKKLLFICLPKCLATAEHCWRSLLVGQYMADPWTFDQMQQKMTLQRFQYEKLSARGYPQGAICKKLSYKKGIITKLLTKNHLQKAISNKPSIRNHVQETVSNKPSSRNHQQEAIGLATSDVNKTACYIRPKVNTTTFGLSPRLEKHETALLMLGAFGGLSITLAIIYKTLRRVVFRDVDNLDTTFDAGGNVSMSLTAVTVASQLLWPADLLQSSTVTEGIAAPFWYTVGVVVNMILFPVLSVRFKSIAPGAKTYVQLMYARFGKATHIWYCFLALLINVIILVCILVTVRATIMAVTHDASIEFVCLVSAVLFGSYSFVGGLGTTFYVSYFNALFLVVILMVIIFAVLFSSSTSQFGLGDMEKMYDVLSCLEGPEGNYGRSFLTFRSLGSFMWGMIGLCQSAAVTFCDQASWQSRIAAKPSDGVIGFLVATAIWFAIPSALGTTAGMAYLVMSHQNGTHLLSEDEIDIGMITPLVYEKLFGKTGAVLVLIMYSMAYMSTGSGEVMSIASIIVYDIYQIHVNPFRSDVAENRCIFCGSIKLNDESDSPEPSPKTCCCPEPRECQECQDDTSRRARYPNGVPYRCKHHANLRQYQAQLLRYKSWCIIWVSICVIPLGIVVLSANLNLNWAMLYGVMLSVCSFPGVVLSVLWTKTSKVGVLSGSMAGLTITIVLNLILASRESGGLSNFFVTSVNITTVFVAGSASLVVNFAITIAASLIADGRRSADARNNVWKATQNIDNPLHPWSDRFVGEIRNLQYGQRPTVKQLEEMSRPARLQAYIGSAILITSFILIIPVTMVSFPILSFVQFRGWVLFCAGWACLMAGIAVILAPIQEAIQIIGRMRRNRVWREHGTSMEPNSTTFISSK